MDSIIGRKRKAQDTAGTDTKEDSLTSKDGTYWSTDNQITKRFQAADIIPISSKPGLKNIGKVCSGLESFFTFMKIDYLETAVLFTNRVLLRDRTVMATGTVSRLTWSRNKANFVNTNLEELKAFIGLLMLSSSFDMSLHGCWTNPLAPPHFAATMSFRRFLVLLTKIRFDDHETRRERRAEDKFAALRDVFDDFAKNLSLYSNPSGNVTIDEMTVPYRGFKCGFVVYNKDKPNPYGIKLWMLADAEQRFVYNLQPYVGKVNNKSEKGIGERVVRDLIEPISQTCRNVCADNYFSTRSLAESLKIDHKLTYIGTVRSNHVGIPPHISSNSNRPEGDTKYAYHGRTQLLSVIVKKKKNVIIINSGRITEETQNCLTKGGEPKTKPALICVYNKLKGGVDSIDQLCSYIDIAPRTKRWSVAVFCRLLEIALVNGYTLLKMDSSYPASTSKTRFKFTQDIALQLILPFMMKRDQSNLSRPLKSKIICAILNAPDDLVAAVDPMIGSVMEDPKQLLAKPGRCRICLGKEEDRKTRGNLKKVKTCCTKCSDKVCKKHSLCIVYCDECRTDA